MVNKQKIVKALNNNEIVSIPTETVYGLFIKISPENMFRLNLYKKRDKMQPLQIMFPNVEAALPFVEINSFQESILKAELPGNKSIIVPANKKFSKKYLHGQKTVSLRIPLKSQARNLISILEIVGPCFATSVNNHGEKMLNDYLSILNKYEDILVLKGKPGSNVSSTIVELKEDSIEILRGEKK